MYKYKIYKGYKICNNGAIYNKDSTIKKLTENSSGYLVVDLYENGKRERHLVHRLIAKLFIENEYNKKVVNHLDGNKKNNNFDNLQWSSHTENNKHAYKTGLKTPLHNPLFNAKLSVEQVVEIKEMLKSKSHKQIDIANMFKVSKSTISMIKQQKIWKDVCVS